MPKYNTQTHETDFHFQYPSLEDPIFSEVRKFVHFNFDSKMSDLEKAKEIVGYAHSLFTHDGNNTPSSSDPLTILKEAQTGQSFRCVEYSILAAGLLWAYGIPSRTVGLKTEDVETRKYGAGHVVIEFWSKELQKWIMCDVQAGIIPQNEEILLSCYELADDLENSTIITYSTLPNSRFSPDKNYGEKPSYSDWIREYLYFIDTPIDMTLRNEDRQKQQIAMLVPLNVTPPRLFQGMFEMNALYTHSTLDFYPEISN